MKGSGEGGEVLASMLMIVIMLGMFGIYAATAFSETNKRQTIMLDEAELIRVKNTFSLVSASLGQTWLLSVAQSVFKTADKSVGCGFEVANLEPKYWYNYDPSQFRDSICLDTGTCEGEPRIPEAEKYNSDDYNPRICYPRKVHLDEMLTEKMQPYLDINKSFELNAVKVRINNTNSTVNATPGRVIGNTSENVRAFIGARSIYNDNTTHTSVIFSQLLQIVESARSVVNEMLLLSNKLAYEAGNSDYDYSMRYQDTLGIPTPSHEFYENQIKEYIEQRISDSTTSLADVKVKPVFNVLELIVPTEEQQKIWGLSGNIDPRRGLVLHYDLLIKFSEGSEAESTSCDLNAPQRYEEIIRNAVASKTWRFTDIDVFPPRITTFSFSNEEIEALIKAVIQRESAWILRQISPCGAAGLMQLMPGTAKDLGIQNIFENAEFTACSDMPAGYVDRLNAAINGKSDEEIKSIDGRFDAEKNIVAGVKYIHDLLDKDELKEDSPDKENLMKLAIASYNAGPGGVASAIQQAQSSVYASVEPFLPPETQDYVSYVLGNYICYGGSADIGGLYYFYDEANDRFVKRPFIMEMKLGDYLPVIDCNEEPYQSTPPARTFYWTQGRQDMMCCRVGGVLNGAPRENLIYTCQTEIPEIGDANLNFGDRLECPTGDFGVTYVCDAAGFSVLPPPPQ